MIITCSFCGITCDKPTGQVNRTLKLGRKLYCSHFCHTKSKEVILQCDHCRKSFKTTKSIIKFKKIDGQDKFYCSNICAASNRKVTSKVCSGCGVHKLRSGFRTRTKKGYTYIEGKCKECERNNRKIYYDKVKDDPCWIEHSRELSKKSRTKNATKIIERTKIRRATKEYKSWRDKYNKLNKSHILSKRRTLNKKYSETISDGYARWRLMSKGNKTPSNEEVELQKVQILIRRIKIKINQINKHHEK